jgi:hypothetical protein
VQFATKPTLAKAMLCRALDPGGPASWVTGDEVYGADPTLRAWVEGRGIGYVLAVACDHPSWPQATPGAPMSWASGSRHGPGSLSRPAAPPRATASTTGRSSDPNRAWANLHATPRALGAALLDQSVIAGIVFRTEALFACRLHPSRPAASLTRAEFDRLWATVCAMMHRAVDDGRIVTVDPPAGRSRTDIPEDEARYIYKQACCRRCGAPVASWSLGGRTTYACPVEQPAA